MKAMDPRIEKTNNIYNIYLFFTCGMDTRDGADPI